MKFIAFYVCRPVRDVIYVRAEYTNGECTPNERRFATRFDTRAEAEQSATAVHLRQRWGITVQVEAE